MLRYNEEDKENANINTCRTQTFETKVAMKYCSERNSGNKEEVENVITSRNIISPFTSEDAEGIEHIGAKLKTSKRVPEYYAIKAGRLLLRGGYFSRKQFKNRCEADSVSVQVVKKFKCTTNRTNNGTTGNRTVQQKLTAYRTLPNNRTIPSCI